MTAPLDAQRWQRIDDLFQQALDRADDERSEFLRRAAGGDTTLIAEVRALLAAHGRSASFLDAPPAGGAARLLDLEAPGAVEDLVGSRLGPYRITRELASGGMGAVYLAARDDDLYRKIVAVKLVRRGLLGSSAARRQELQRRFHVERQALANLDHPNIARLLDGGTSADGRPYLVMEYVQGVSIDEHCARHRLSIRGRLALFAKVCAAVQHAHQNLVIHRDLKPGNILVMPDGEPKLLDFGLAKLLDPRRDPAAAAATTAGEFMGTFAYAAPEQVAATGTAPDTRSDVYALGLILYRLLAGRHAYDLGPTVAEAVERITTQLPVPPSRLERGVGDELDSVVLKALAKEPRRRYQSAGDLLADVERYLRGDAVLARGDSGWYILRKTIHRYRAPLAVAAGFTALVSALAVYAASQALRLEEQRAALADALHVSNVERGRAMGAAGNMALAEQLLWTEYLHGSEPAGAPDNLARWALWELYLGQPCLRTLTTGLPGIDAMARSADGRWLAVARRDHKVRIVDARSGALHLEIGGARDTVTSLVFHPSRPALVVTGEDGIAALWEVEAGTPLAELLHEGPVRGAAFSGDGTRLVTATAHEVITWEDDGGEAIVRAAVPEAAVRAVALSPDGSAIAVGGADGRVRLLDAATGRVRGSYFDAGRSCNVVCFSPDGRYLAADVNGVAVGVIDLIEQRIVMSAQDAAGWVRSLAFAPGDGPPWRLAGASVDKTVLVWEVPTGTLIRRFHGHDAPVAAVHFAAGGAHLVSGGDEPGARVWEMAALGCLEQWSDPGTIFDVRFTADGRRVITSSGDGDHAIRVRDAGTGAIIDVLEGHEAAVASVAQSPDRRWLVSAGYDRTLRAWPLDAAPGAGDGPRWTTVTAPTAVNSVTWSPDGGEIAFGGDDGAIRVIRASDAAPVETIEPGCGRIPSLRFSSDGRLLAAALITPDAVVVFDRAGGRRHDLDWSGASPRIVRFSPDGSMLAAAGDSSAVQLWSLRRGDFGECVASLRGHLQDVFAIAFSPDASLLATGGRSGIVKLWSVSGGHCLATLPGHRDMVFSVAFSPDGRRLLSAGRDRVVHVWDLAYYDRHLAGNADYRRRLPG